MKILKIIYDNSCKYIINIVDDIPVTLYVEAYNISNYKEKKLALPIMTRHGTKNVPLLVFEDENLVEYEAIWSEENPNWEEEILKILEHEDN